MTEDADLGLRLARFGFEVATLDSTTMEVAPTRTSVWMRQRRRWMKGWMQTFLVLACDMRRVCREFGWARFAALLTMSVNMVLGPLFLPVFSILLIRHIVAFGLPAPGGAMGYLEIMLDLTVFLSGLAMTLWPAYAGLRSRRLNRFLARLPLMLPYQLMISAAAWMALWDLAWRPYHWHKTPH